MKIIAFIEREDLIQKILKHVGLWEVKCRPPPKIHPPHIVSPICPLRINTTTIKDTNQKAEIINTTERSSILHIAFKNRGNP